MNKLPKTARQTALDRILQIQATPWVVLVISLIITGFAWHIADRAVEKRIAERFEYQATDIVSAITKRMQEYEVVLRSGLGLFKASEVVSREEWKALTDNLNIEKYYPGIQGIGFSLMVPPEKKEEHERSIRSEGFPDYRIKPDGERDMYSAIIYLEPFDWRNQRAFGYDMFSQETRKNAMERARDTGVAAMSGRVTLVQETDKDVQYGFLLYLPLYRKNKALETVLQRQEELVGYVYSPFRVKDLMRGILLAAQEDISFEIYDGETPSPETILYNHAEPEKLLYNNSAHKPQYDGLYKVTIAGRVWSLYLYSKPGFTSQEEENQPLFVAFGGILVDVMLFLVILINSRKRKLAEALAGEMTRELEEKSRELARSNDELEQFVYTVSHDLKSPLVTSMGFIGIVNKLAKRGEYEKALEKLKKVVEANNRMGQLINDLVELSRVGRIDLDKKQLDMNLLLQKLKEEKQRRFHNAKITLIVEKNLPLIYGNESRVLQVFENILSNALKYAVKPKGSKVTIGGITRKNEALLYVKDDGPGIEPDFHQKIFGLFQRLDNTIEGTGIGLAVVKKVMQFHEGKVWVESSPGKGAAFWLSFPTEQKVNNN
ncbi:MAG: CHASE domain-containing protein [Candidatus Electrothrix sp. YB6]